MVLTSPEDIYDVYTFKLIKRLIKKKFPWIKDVFVRKVDTIVYKTIFLNFDFDPNEFSETYGFPTKKWIQEMIDKGEYIDLSYPNLINDMQYEEYRRIRDDIKRTIKDVSENPALPDEFKFDNRGIAIGSWHINRNSGEAPFLTI